MYDLNAKIELPTNIFFVYTLSASCHMAVISVWTCEISQPFNFLRLKIRSATAAELTNVRCAKPTH